MPAISVIVPVYNTERYLEKCLSSILGQSFTDLELICIDDGSTDASLEILESFAHRDSRVVVLHQANRYAGVARNVGMRCAEGDYLLFFDSDDYMQPDMLKRLYEYAELYESEIVVCEYDTLSYGSPSPEQGRRYAAYAEIEPDSTYAGANLSAKLFQLFMGWPWDKLFKHSFVRSCQIEFQDLRSTNDAFFVFTALMKARSIGVVEEPLCVHRINDSSSLENSRGKSYRCFCDGLHALRESMQADGSYALFEQSFINWSITFSLWQLLSMDSGKQKKVLAIIRSEIVPWLALGSRDDAYFYDVDERDWLEILVSDDSERISRAAELYMRIDVLKRRLPSAEQEVGELTERLLAVIKVRDEYSELCRSHDETISSLRTQADADKSQIAELSARLKDSAEEVEVFRSGYANLKKKIEDLMMRNEDFKKENADLKKKHEEFLHSRSYRIGRAVTWVPRKCRRFLRQCIRSVKGLEPHALSMRLELTDRERLYQIRKHLPHAFYKYGLDVWYFNKTGHHVDWKNPAGFNDKIQWLKIFDSTPLKGRLADKYRVRQWIADEVDESYLVPLIGVYDKPEEIDFVSLPNRYVVKATHGSGWNIVVENKSTANVDAILHNCKFWLEHDFALWFSYEMQYSYCERRIIIEEWQDIREEMQFWCFNGKVEFIGLVHDPHGKNEKAFFDREWNRQDFVSSLPIIEEEIECPSYYASLLPVAEKLSRDFIHVRVDFFCTTTGRVYFSEMTFTSATGLVDWHPVGQNEIAGNLIQLK